jgi:4'-phosphopantetheinyl transferase
VTHAEQPGVLAADRPRVWLIDTVAEWFVELGDADVTSDAERKRAGALAEDSARRRLLARRSALRYALASRLGIAPADVPIVTAPGGKPVLLPGDRAGPALSFSVAHSGELYAIAIAPVASLGLDVERIRSVPRARSIAARWFGPREARRLDELEGDDLVAEFMKFWTGKEALAKRHGAGLRLMRGEDAELDLEPCAGSGRLRFFEPRDGYAGAIASTEVIDELEVVRPDSNPWTT